MHEANWLKTSTELIATTSKVDPFVSASLLLSRTMEKSCFGMGEPLLCSVCR